MIKAFEAHGVVHPWYYIVSSESIIDELRGITFPCITKPTDNSGSRGVMLVKNADELKAAIKYSSSQGRCGSVIIEEYMRGPEVV
jgi:biotin carboxylase